MTRISIKTVAAAAGVSFQTTSKVLNGKGNVSAETRARIVRAAAELGYVPNAAARSLVTRSTRTIGVVASDLSDFVLAQFVVGAEREARRQGQCVVIGSVDPDGSDGERYLRMLIERRVDGLLLAAPELEEAPYVAPIVRDRLPVVSIHAVPGGDVSLVGSDHVRAGLLATGHLLELGRRRIATITGTTTRRVVRSRVRGYARALEGAGIALDPALVEAGDWEVESGHRATIRLLERAPDLDAIFVHNDTMAIGVLSALHARGRRVPSDCAVIACDDIPTAAYTIPPLSTLHVPFHETGATAMRLLLEIIADPPAAARRVMLPIDLVCRASCGCRGRGDAA